MSEEGTRAALLIDTFDVNLSETTVMRISRKVFGMDEVLDMRLWGVAKTGNLYPKKGKGLCMKVRNWQIALKILSDNNLIPGVPITNS